MCDVSCSCLLQVCPRGLALIQRYSRAWPGSTSARRCQVRQLPHPLHRMLRLRGAESTFWDSCLPPGRDLSQRVAFYPAPAIVLLLLSAALVPCCQLGGGLPSTNTDPSPEMSTSGCSRLCVTLPCLSIRLCTKFVAMHATGKCSRQCATGKQRSELQGVEVSGVRVQCLA